MIGTHALLSDQIRFGRLGLIVIDEEQHFGVAQKERIKSMKTSVARAVRPLSLFARSSPCCPRACSACHEWFGHEMHPAGASAMPMIVSHAAVTSPHVAGGSVMPAASRMDMLDNKTVLDVFQGIE